MEAGIGLIFALIFGAICSAIANSKGRSAVGWFFGGFLLGWIGLIIIACLSNLNVEQRHRQQMQFENRRLRERLRQESLKNESFRQHASQRLDAHDKTLGVDTRKINQLEGQTREQPRLVAKPVATTASTSAPPPEPPVEPVQEVVDETEWFYVLNDERVGPLTTDHMIYLQSNGTIDGETLVWCEEMDEWTPLILVNRFQNG